jgi:hypothetical protein
MEKTNLQIVFETIKSKPMKSTELEESTSISKATLFRTLKNLLDEYKQELYSKDLLLEKTKTELKICKNKIDFYYIDLKYKDKMIRKYKNFLECYKDELKQLKGENPFE